MLASKREMNNQPNIMPEILQEKVANIQKILTLKDMENLKSTIIADLKEPIKIMCNQANKSYKKISDAEEILKETVFLGLYIDIVKGMINIQTTSKTFLTETLEELAREFKTAMQNGVKQEKNKNFGNHKNPFNFLSYVLQSATPVETLQETIENLKEYAAIVNRNITANKFTPRFEFPEVNRLQVIELQGEPLKETKEIEIRNSQRNLLSIALASLKEPFYKIMALNGTTTFFILF